jgi:hypothetical protein
VNDGEFVRLLLAVADAIEGGGSGPTSAGIVRVAAIPLRRKT